MIFVYMMHLFYSYHINLLIYLFNENYVSGGALWLSKFLNRAVSAVTL